MKSDCSRDTFDARKHFSSVRMQQGRVQLDADWNEQHDIVAHRARAETADIVGPCGGPLHRAAFHIVSQLTELTPEEQALPGNGTLPTGFAVPDFLISAGQYYVDGILCENERLSSYLKQPDLPGAAAITAPGLYIVYVDVWQRHLTALDDPSIREIALGGPDTASRTKTVWQVKYWFAGAAATGSCLTTFADFNALIAPGDGRLSARSSPEQTSTSPCIVPPGAGFRGLENQLYRVEVHDGGTAFDATGSGSLVTRVPNSDNQVRFTGSGDPDWTEGHPVDVFSSSDPMKGTLAYITARDNAAKTLTLNISVSSLALDELRLRDASATYKWSRNNGAIVTAIESINGREVTVHDLGPDDVLGFQEGQWVEISDDGLELNGRPGQLAQISEIDRAINVITLSLAPKPLSAQAGGVDKTLHPKLRGWDGIGAVKFHTDHFLDLEDGVQVRFFAGSFKTGDYWNIPARTATADTQSGNIEWPTDSSGAPLAQLPSGIEHRYCRLAMLHWNGTQFDAIEDCRHLFPPATELTSLFYVSGDGQEAMPDLTQPTQLVQLPRPVVVGVANGSWPVKNAKVRLHVTAGDGHVLTGAQGGVQINPATIDVRTDTGGQASCIWQIDAHTQSQQLTATLLDADDHPVHLPVIFTANLSVASQVAYDPGPCGSLQGQKTVQQAIDRLSQLMSLYKLSGDGQEIAAPGAPLAPLRVLVATGCGPVTDPSVTVTFTIVGPGAGKVTDGSKPDADSISIPVETSAPNAGVASCLWKPDLTTPFQEVEAKIEGSAGHPVIPPTTVRFSATLTAMREPGVRIKEVQTATDRQPLVNDTLVPVARLKEGIAIFCDQILAPESVGRSPDPPSGFPTAVAEKPTCFVTLDLPYPIGTDRNFWDFGDTFGFESVIVACTVTIKDDTILWTPTAPAGAWLQQILFARLTGARIADRVLAHLTLKGNFIWAKSDNDPAMYLDGESFGVRSSTGRTALRLPSGDGRRGGNFESWFWLVPG